MLTVVNLACLLWYEFICVCVRVREGTRYIVEADGRVGGFFHFPLLMPRATGQ